jgi:glycosyltransferase involved in cell wall biosynthesis
LPLVSIITPSFRASNWLKLCIASVADQEGVTLEHIVQDACSEDGTKDWLPTDPHVTAFIEKDNGMYDAVNRGLRRSTGTICAYLNADEQYLPKTLEKISSFFESHPNVDIVFGDVLVVDREGRARAYRRAIQPLPAHIRLSHLNTFSCATFFRRRVLEQGFWLDPKWKSIGDAIWIHDMLKAGLQSATYPDLLSIFTLTGTNLSIDDSVSDREKQAWLTAPGAPAKILRPWHVGLHRVRKFLAGAYTRRTFDYEIYTRDSPDRRVRFNATNLGGRWKRNDQSSTA